GFALLRGYVILSPHAACVRTSDGWKPSHVGRALPAATPDGGQCPPYGNYFQSCPQAAALAIEQRRAFVGSALAAPWRTRSGTIGRPNASAKVGPTKTSSEHSG